MFKRVKPRLVTLVGRGERNAKADGKIVCKLNKFNKGH
jgi:hypothetical protein